MKTHSTPPFQSRLKDFYWCVKHALIYLSGLSGLSCAGLFFLTLTTAVAQDTYQITFGGASIIPPANQISNYGATNYANWGVTKNGAASSDLSFSAYYNGVGASTTVIAASAPLSTTETDAAYVNPSGANYLSLPDMNTGFIIGNIPMLADASTRSFTLSFGISARGSGANGANLADLVFEYLNTAGNYVVIPTASFTPNASTVGEEWKYYQGSVTSSQIADNLFIRVYRTANNGAKPVVFDDIKIGNIITCNIAAGTGYNKVWVGAGAPYQTNTGSTSFQFNNASNWCPAGAPNSTHSVLFNSSSTATITVSGNITVKKLTVICSSAGSAKLPLFISANRTLTVGDGGLTIYASNNTTNIPTAEIQTSSTARLIVNGPTIIGNEGNGNAQLGSTASLGGTMTFNGSVLFGPKANFGNSRPSLVNFKADVINNKSGLNFKLPSPQVGGTVAQFTGTTEQRILGNEPIDFYDFTLNNSAGVDISGTDAHINIGRLLTCLDGVLETGNNKVVFGAAASISETNESFINGNLELLPRSISTTAESFGNLGLQISLPNAGTNSYNATVVRKTGLPIVNPSNPDYQSVTKQVTITVTQKPGGEPVPVNLEATMDMSFWAHEHNYFPLEKLVFFRQHPDLGIWVDMGSDNPDGIPTGSGPYTLTLSGIEAFSTWTIGQAFSPLPVELIAFSAKRQTDDALLQWSTASEENNLGYYIEAGSDNRNFQRIGFVTASEIANQVNHYTYTEKQASRFGPVRYYRLIQEDLDGTKTNLGVRSVGFDDKGITVAIGPNPFFETFAATIVTDKDLPATLTLTDALGRVVSRQNIQLSKGANTSNFNGSQLSSGLYMLSVQLPDQTLTTKLTRY